MPEIEMSEYLREYDDMKTALEAASSEASATGGRVDAAIIFQQGNRSNLALAMTMNDLRNHVRRNSASARGDLLETINRPLIPDHAKTIEEYVVKNADEGYILPSITLTVSTDLSVYTMRSPSPVRAAWLVLTSDTRFLVTDGQHRLVALTGNLDQVPRHRGVGETP